MSDLAAPVGSGVPGARESAHRPATFLPLMAEDMIEPYQINGMMPVRGVMRELLAARALVTLFPGERTDPFIVSPLLSLQAKTIELECAASPEHLDAIASAPYLTAVSTTGSVKVQFRLEGIRIDDRASRRPRLSAPIPSFAWRVQRRNDFRVQPPEPDEATVVVRRPREGELVTRLIDLSAGGVSMQWPRDVSMPFGLGTTLHHCRIEAAPIAPIPCDLRVVRIQSGEPFVISCEFYAMPQEVSRFVQMYVMDVERRLRR